MWGEKVKQSIKCAVRTSWKIESKKNFSHEKSHEMAAKQQEEPAYVCGRRASTKYMRGKWQTFCIVANRVGNHHQKKIQHGIAQKE